MDQQSQAAEALGRNKVMALHQIMARALSRQWTLIDDRDYREKSPINRALKKVEQLNSLVNDGYIDSERYRKKLRTLMVSLKALELYDFVAEEVIQTFGPEAGIVSNQDEMAETLAWIQSQGIEL